MVDFGTITQSDVNALPRRKCAIFDIDGTIADLSHRRPFIAVKPKNYLAFHKGCVSDAPIAPILNMILATRAVGLATVLCSGRDGEFVDLTKQWLDEATWEAFDGEPRTGVPYDALYIRAPKDYRADDIIKEELLDELLADGWDPQIVFDDRDRVVAMWRRRGLKCCQVEPGDF